MLKSAHSLVSVLALAGAPFAQTFEFPLEGSQVTPPIVTAGFGEATLTLNATSGDVQIAGTYTNLSGAASAAHLHMGGPGITGGVIVGLTVTGGTSGSFSGGGTLGSGQVTNLLKGLMYVNVHSAAFGTGELRGQVVQAAAAQPYGGNPPGSLTVLAGEATVGDALTLGVDDPTGGTPVGALPFVGIATAVDPLFAATGTGLLLPGWGLGGGAGELLIAVGGGNPALALSGPAWGGPGVPAPLALTVPPQPTLIGVEVFAQGLLVDLAGPGPTFGLTNGLALTIGS